MAEKRMFTRKVIDSDAFLEMPLSAQALYFHLNMHADDDGFVNNPRKITRYVGAAEDDLKILLLKRFLIGFESGVIVIKHWRMHNTLKSDRYHPTEYQEELAQLSVKKNKAYTDHPLPPEEQLPVLPPAEAEEREAGPAAEPEGKQAGSTAEPEGKQAGSAAEPEGKQAGPAMETGRNRSGTASEPENRLGLGLDLDSGLDSDSGLDLDSGLDSDSGSGLTTTGVVVCRTKDVRRIVEAWNSLGLQQLRRLASDSARGGMLRARVNQYGVAGVLEAIEKVRSSEFLNGQNSNGWVITFEWFVKPNNFIKVLEGNYDGRLSVQKKNGAAEMLRDSYSMMREWAGGKGEAEK